MSRKGRVWIEGACYHLTTRGNRKQRVHLDEEDYERYLKILKRGKMRYGMRLYAYCVMPNHVHLLVDPPVVAEVSRFMHWVNRGYADYFNRKYNAVGHVWQGRYGDKPVMTDEYLTACAEYIEANPVRAGIVATAADYRWSSYRERCGLSGRERLIDDIAALLSV